MGKGANKQLLGNSATAQQNSSQLMGNANNLYGSLAPQLQNQAINPQGLSPTDSAAMTTAAMQSAGGTAAGAAGQGKLYEMRTKNAGAAGNAIAAGAQNAGQQLGQEAVGQQAMNAKLKETQRENALKGMGSLYGEELGGAGNFLNSSNQALGTENQWKNPWQSAGMQILSNGQKAADAAAMGG
jgi:hypothetical protein